MKIKRTRTYYIDPHYRSRVVWTYGAFETHYSRHTGEPFDIAKATGRTPVKAKIAARKTRKKRYQHDWPVTRQDRDLERRIAQNYENKMRITPADIRRAREFFDKKAEQNVHSE